MKIKMHSQIFWLILLKMVRSHCIDHLDLALCISRLKIDRGPCVCEVYNAEIRSIQLINDLVVDNSTGDIYVTGWYISITDFDPGEGTLMLTSNGFFYGGSFIQKLDSEGNLLWAVTFPGTFPGALP